MQRIYVAASVFDAFVAKFVELAKGYRLGDPTDANTNLGPVVSVASADRIRKQIDDACACLTLCLHLTPIPPILFSVIYLVY